MKGEEKIAGLHTYRGDKGNRHATPIETVNTEDGSRNGLLDAINTKPVSERTRQNPRSNRFDMKLLSNMDEFNYYA